ncbi:MAG: secondary thiamine-phosphate synthase enzyme YjbQ [Verrucomicrobiota bacterium]
MVFQGDVIIQTRRHGDVCNITDHVQEIVVQSNVTNGIAQIFNVGSTGAVGTIECEAGLEEDLPKTLDRLIPPGRKYAHEQAWHDGNAHSHLQATSLGASLTVPVRNRQVVLGTWQQIFHIECGTKGRERRIVVTVIGE